MGLEVAVWLFWMWGMKSQGVEFVVAHDCKGCPGVDHGPDDLKGFPDLGAAVDEVTEEDRGSLAVAVGPVFF